MYLRQHKASSNNHDISNFNSTSRAWKQKYAKVFGVVLVRGGGLAGGDVDVDIGREEE